MNDMPEKIYLLLNEVVRGTMFLHADVKCHDCGHVLSLANAGSIDNGKCNRCGGKTS